MPMLPRKRKAQLIEKGFTVTGIAKQVGVSQPMVSHVIAGRRRSQRVEQAIAEALGKSVVRVFGKPRAA